MIASPDQGWIAATSAAKTDVGEGQIVLISFKGVGAIAAPSVKRPFNRLEDFVSIPEVRSRVAQRPLRGFALDRASGMENARRHTIYGEMGAQCEGWRWRSGRWLIRRKSEVWVNCLMV